MKTYSEDDLILIQQYETSRLNAANDRYTNARSAFEEAKAMNDRWFDGSLGKDVINARIEFGRWTCGALLIAGSFLLNCVLIQEITPDLVALIRRIPIIPESMASMLATGLLTGMLFGILFAVKKASNLVPDLAALRPGLHPAVAKPLKKRVRQKVAIKLGYLALVGFAYFKLYAYISGGVALEQAGLESQRELQNLLGSGLGTPETPITPLDQDIASSQAASFAVYYCLEWLLHATILFVSGTRFPAERLHFLRLSSRKDDKSFRAAKSEFNAASRTLCVLCQERTPDDGVNDLRRGYLGAMESEPSATEPSIVFSKAACNGHDRKVPLPA